ncbi:MAG TPA: nucleotide exchange factor GrpE [Alphaproteobacteria bacterium]|nr:nucleotide exchange factor GrpE [Alphaproteobacteria bacterium]HOO51028.1 nucleotide exchange factor GrpE [Alphaproteobacteria bacterium]
MSTEHNKADPNPAKEATQPDGFTDLTGPAAFKAKNKQAENPSEQEPMSAPNAEQAMENVGNISEFAAQNTEMVAKLEKALADTKDQLIRTVADMENLRKRSAREREDALKYSISGFARDLLDVSDTFRRALDSIPADLKEDNRINPLVEGIEAMERALLTVFEKNGLKKIEPLDEVFNPNFHEVMFEAPMPDKANGTIIQIIEPGYLLHDRLLRPARVGISKSDQGNNHNLDTQA